MKKRSALVLAAALLVPSAAFAAPQSAASALDAIAARQRFAHAIVAADVYDLDAKRQLYVRNAAVLMEAALTTKLLTDGDQPRPTRPELPLDDARLSHRHG